MDRQKPLSAAILISGGGSNLQAFIDAVAVGELKLDIRVVLSNREDAGGLARAKNAAIPRACIQHRDFPRREEFDAALVAALTPFQPEIIILAGFMRILTPVFITPFADRILNIHPSLLPKYPGLNTHARAIEAGEDCHGSTVHFVTEQLDGGPRIMQGRVPILSGDSAEVLASRVLQVEHRIYPRVLALYADGRLRCHDDHAWLDGKRLDDPLTLSAA